MCKSEMIILKSKYQWYVKKVSRQKMIIVFDGLAKGFSKDYELFLKLADIAKQADELIFSKDTINLIDYMQIDYKVNGKIKCIRFDEYQKVAWAIIERFYAE